MECDENGRQRTLPAATYGRGVKRKCRTGQENILRLAFAPSVSDANHSHSMRVNLVPHCPPEQPISTAIVQPADHPFMNNMDEISYWVYTKRAPCLFNYDNVVKKQIEQPHCSKTKPVSIQSACEEVPSPKIKKRKLKLLDDEDSVSTEKQHHVYFETPKCEKQKNAPSSCKSEAIASNIDFNIKNSPQQKTTKRIKLQRNCHTTSQKKNKLVTSTPKATNLRRSLRKAQQNHNDSFEMLNTTANNGLQDEKQEHNDKGKLQKLQQSADRSKNKRGIDKDKNAVVLNGQFEDLSDVSGFTANYIRSTKIVSSKTPRKLRSRNSRNLMKDAKPNVTAESEKMLVCVNKSVNTPLPDNTAQNCSTDSSQNLINLVSVKSNEKSSRVNKSTSLLKFMDTKASGSNSKIEKKGGKNNLNISFQSKSSGASRYPRRQRNNLTADSENCSKIKTTTLKSVATRHNGRKSTLHNSNKKEVNSRDKSSPKTRGGKKVESQLGPEESMLQLNDSSEQVSSSVAFNVASPAKKSKNVNNSTVRCLRNRRCRDKSGVYKDSISDKSDKKNEDNAHSSALPSSTPRHAGRVRKVMDKTSLSLRRDSLRDKSGFAACFSDSDSDSEPLKQRKFFC